MKKWLAWLLCLCMLTTAPTCVSVAAEDRVITLSGDSASWTGNGISFSQNVLKISQAGTYTLTGELNGQVSIEVSKDDEVELKLRGVSLSNPSGAAIMVEQAGKVTLELEEHCENRVISGTCTAITAESAADEEASGAAIQAKCDLKIKGKGALFVGGYIHQGIRTSKDLDVKNGQITIEAIGSGIRCKDKLEVVGGSLRIVSGGDGIHGASEATDAKEADGHVIIRGGEISIESYGDGIQSETTLLIEGGALDIMTGGGSALAPVKNEYGGGFFRGMNWDMDASADDATVSTKGIKASETLEVSGGMVTIDSYDDSLHAAGKITISGGLLTLKTGDDGIHSDTEMLISGGTINVLESYEGIEAQLIQVTGGDIRVNAKDDGINASGGVVSFGMNLGGGGMQGGKHGSGRFDNRAMEANMPQAGETPPTMPDNAPAFDGNMARPAGTSGASFAMEGNMPQPGETPPAMPDNSSGMNGNKAWPDDMADERFKHDDRMQNGMSPEMRGMTPVGQRGDESEMPLLTISGGSVYVNAQGDGLDSNGNLLIEGGTVIIDGSNNGGNGALDSGSENGGTLRVTGGTVLAIGASGMADCFESTSAQAYVCGNTRWNAGDTIVIVDAGGKELLRHEAAKAGQSVIFSSPELVEGESVTVSAGNNKLELIAGFENSGYSGFGRRGW